MVAEGTATHDRRPPGVILEVDLHERRVGYRGYSIPTKPPDNLQRQPLLAWAVLAARPGEAVSMAELAERMNDLGAFRKRPIAPEATEIRYRMLRPFKKALNGAVPAGEIGKLIDNIDGKALRLNLSAEDVHLHLSECR